SAAWSGATTRTNALTRQNGVLVKSGVPTRRWVGMMRTVSATTSEDSKLKRFVANAYNRVARVLKTVPKYNDDNISTTYTTNSTSYVRANGGTGSRLEFLAFGDEAILLRIYASMNN